MFPSLVVLSGSFFRMKSWYLALCALCLSVAAADNALQIAGRLSLNSRYGMGTLLQRADLAHRVRRQTMMLGPRDPEQCVADCIETMDEKLIEAFPEAARRNSTDDDDVADVILKSDYDPAKFEEFCDIYTPSSRCLHQCPRSDLRYFSEKSFAMVEYMCVDRYDDFRKYGSCMDNASKEIDEICDKQCVVYKEGMEKLENVTKEDNAEDYDDLEINALLNQSCIYISCLIHCDQPIMTEKCGQKAAALELDTVRIAFKSLNDLLATSARSDVWPESCERLGEKEKNNEEGQTVLSIPKSSVSLNDTRERNVSLSQEKVKDSGED